MVAFLYMHHVRPLLRHLRRDGYLPLDTKRSEVTEEERMLLAAYDRRARLAGRIPRGVVLFEERKRTEGEPPVNSGAAPTAGIVYGSTNPYTSREEPS
jgi:hypothetical protein